MTETIKMLDNTIVMDCETGGLDPVRNGLCSVTFKKYGKYKPLTIFIKPNRKLEYHPKALEINGLSLEWLEEHGTDEDVAVKIIYEYVKKNFSQRPTPLGHNVNFDINFLKELFKRHELNYEKVFHYHFQDTMIIAKFLKNSGIINTSNIKLTTVYKEFFNESFENAHTSEADVIATERVYDELLRLMKHAEYR